MITLFVSSKECEQEISWFLASINIGHKCLLRDLMFMDPYYSFRLRRLCIKFHSRTNIVQRIKILQKNDLQLKQFMEKVDKGCKSYLVLLDYEILRFKTRFCVPNHRDLRRELLE